MKRSVLRLTLAAITLSVALLPVAPSRAAGPEGAIIGGGQITCSGSSGPLSCTYISTVNGGYIAVGNVSIVATNSSGTVVFKHTCSGPCTASEDYNGVAYPIPANLTVTVTAGSSNDVAAVGNPIGMNIPY